MPSIRVMTFNVDGSSFPREGPNAWSRRQALNVATILRHDPDLIGFQEVAEDNLAVYRQRLTEYDHVAGNAYGDNPPEEYTSIFWRAARLALVASGQFWLSRTPDAPSRDWGVPYPMGVTWVRLRERETGVEFVHLNTHFEDGPDGATSRLEGSRLVVGQAAALQQGRLPAIMTGDFNDNPGSAAHRTFLDAGFVDAYLAAGNVDGAASTFHGFEGEGYDARRYSGGRDTFWRVDWILARSATRPIGTAACRIVRDAEPPAYPSDHYPVLAELQIIR